MSENRGFLGRFLADSVLVLEFVQTDARLKLMKAFSTQKVDRQFFVGRLWEESARGAHVHGREQWTVPGRAGPSHRDCAAVRRRLFPFGCIFDVW